MNLANFALLWIYVFHRDVGFSFNINVADPVLFTNNQNGSLFGYSVAIHRSSSGFSVLVGAPRSASVHEATLDLPGALYHCSLRSRNCSQVLLDTSGNSNGGRGRIAYEDGKDGQWMGVALATNRHGNDDVTVCGHRWRNTNLNLTGHHFVNGLCYSVNADLHPASIRALRPLVDRSNQIKYRYIRGRLTKQGFNYGYGQAGAAVQYSRNGEEMLIGAPGLMDWTGGVVEYVNSNTKYVILKPASITSQYAYLGSSVASGYLTEHSDVYYAAGAPRWDYVGKVVVFKDKFRNILVELLGKQMGAYFGACVCVVDVTDDGVDDVLVGAPRMTSASEEGDQGAVYVYVNNGRGGLVEQTDVLTGSHSAGAQFGTALTSLGDINQDGYRDVAVGAPYEDGSGAVYVYHGGPGGVASTPAQRLTPAALRLGLTTFGASLSGDVDLDSNGYPDLVVGAFKSSAVVILHSLPAVTLHVNFDFQETEHIDLSHITCTVLDRYAPCIALLVGFHYEVPHGPDNMDVQFTLQVDTLRTAAHEHTRGWVRLEDRLASVVTHVTSLTRDVLRYERFIVVFDPKESDLVTPVEFKLKYEVLDSAVSTIVLDPKLPTQLSAIISFLRGCGEDNVCHSQLELDQKSSTEPFAGKIVRGQKWPVTVSVEMRCTGETAYLPRLHITYSHLMFSHVEAAEKREQITCLPSQSDERHSDTQDQALICDIGRPLAQNDLVNFTLTFDITSIPPTVEFVTLSSEASTGSVHVTSSGMHTHVLPFPVMTSAHVNVMGTSSPDELLVNEDEDRPMRTSSHVMHFYDIINTGPGLLPWSRVFVTIPQTVNSRVAVLSVELHHEAMVAASIRTCHPYTDTDTGGQVDGMECRGDSCVQYECSLAPLPALSAALVTIQLAHDGHDAGQVTSALHLQIRDSRSSDDVMINGATKVTTPVVQVFANSSPVPVWVSMISAVVGIAILLAAAAALKKVGFFERPTRAKLYKLQLELENRKNDLRQANGDATPVYTSNFNPMDTSYKQPGEQMNGTARPQYFKEPIEQIRLPTKAKKKRRRTKSRSLFPLLRSTPSDEFKFVQSDSSQRSLSHSDVESNRNTLKVPSQICIEFPSRGNNAANPAFESSPVFSPVSPPPREENPESDNDNISEMGAYFIPVVPYDVVEEEENEYEHVQYSPEEPPDYNDVFATDFWDTEPSNVLFGDILSTIVPSQTLAAV